MNMAPALRRSGDAALRRISPQWRKHRKYTSELAFWRGQLPDLLGWYRGTRDAYWGFPAPAPEQRVTSSSIEATNAVLTLHALRPVYLEVLHLEADALTGLRVLEVGCGGLVPLLTFTGCERHALDPLASLYIAAGWPLYDYDCTIVSAAGEHMPYPDGYFDIAISVNALDHVDDFEAVCSEMQRVVKRGGRVFFEVEYHAPTINEPLHLDDTRVRNAFGRSEMAKVCDRGKRDTFAAVGARFGLLPSVYADIDNEAERSACWHGTVA